MKCSLNRFSYNLKFISLKLLLIQYVFVRCVGTSESKHSTDMMMDFDYLVSQLYVQHCTFVEIGEGVCSLFIEMTLNNAAGCKRPMKKQMFFGNCLCSEFRKWHLCSYQLTSQRPEDCALDECSTGSSSSARVHRRLCDVTGMSQWNGQCNCSVTLNGAPQNPMCGFKTCYSNPMPKSICGPRTVCGTSHCDISLHGSLYSIKCDRRCKDHQPFCERPGPATSIKRTVSSEWTEWKPISPSDEKCNIQQYEAECLSEKKTPAFDCLGPGLLCCGNKETDCICEVKQQDGRLKAFRYMITLGTKCGQNYSNIKVRSTGLKGDMKVWNRLMGMNSKGDGEDSVSMFDRPSNLDSYRRRNRPSENKDIASELLLASFTNPKYPDDKLLKQLAMLVNNKSQVLQSNETSSILNNKKLQENIVQDPSANYAPKFSNPDLQAIFVRPNSDSVNSSVTHSMNPHTSFEGTQQVNSSASYLQLMQNSASNSNDSSQNPQETMQQILQMVKEKSNYHFSTPPNNNTAITVKYISEKLVTMGVTISIKDPNEKSVNNIKHFEESSNINKNKDNENKGNEKSYSGEEINEKKLDWDFIHIAANQNNNSYKEKSNNSSFKGGSTVITKDMLNNKNIVTDKSTISPLKNSSLSENIHQTSKNNEVNSQNERKSNGTQNKEADISHEKLTDTKFKNNSQNAITKKMENLNNNPLGNKKMETMIDEGNNSQSELSKYETGGKGNNNMKEETTENVKSQENSSETETDTENPNYNNSDNAEKSLDSEITKENGPKDESETDITKNKENNSQGKRKTNSVVKYEHNSKDGIIVDKEIRKDNLLHSGRKVSSSEAKGQDNNSLSGRKEDSPQEKEKNSNQERKKIENSVNTKLTNQVVNILESDKKAISNDKLLTDQKVNASINKVVSKEKNYSVGKDNLQTPANTTPNLPTIRISSSKQQNGNSLSNSVKIATTQSNNIDGVSQTTEKKINELKPIKPLSNNFKINNENITKTVGDNNNTQLLKNKDQSTNKQLLDKASDMNDIGNLLPNLTVTTTGKLTSKTQWKPQFSHTTDNVENGIKVLSQTVTTPDLIRAIAKKLFKPKLILNDQEAPIEAIPDLNSALVMLPEENTKNTFYDEPEPVLKDLDKVDKENVDDKLAEALNKMVDLKELPYNKVVWREKLEDPSKLVFDRDKLDLEDKDNEPSQRMSTVNLVDQEKNTDRQ